MMIKLFNVIEINPFIYSQENYEIPELSDFLNSKERDDRWQKAVSTLGLNVKLIREDSYFVDIETINDENLKIILKIVFNNDTNIEEDNYLKMFNGGIVLKKDHEFLLEPQCCADLEDIKNWEYIFENSVLDWSQLWIGHPYVYYRKFEEKIEFSDYTDRMLSELDNIECVFEIDQSDLKIEIDKMKVQQVKFKNRVRDLLKEI
ncbi:hypothetical protein MKJ01_07970 [Chryseobacterium sp. SSA4.19]|uniref:hypothetical protein n=1 Tax=Chryseobacterium sp. SSA4.19 TaxID=2919915 RepID=UPI001F4DC8AD|nr:hypothetical protein [Chryseobacterium sp. SSA4.19]MCJ8153690.1 hypothetical protein [Chryseobacterium sp. SSA4.19]